MNSSLTLPKVRFLKWLQARGIETVMHSCPHSSANAFSTAQRFSSSCGSRNIDIRPSQGTVSTLELCPDNRMSSASTCHIKYDYYTTKEIGRASCRERV